MNQQIINNCDDRISVGNLLSDRLRVKKALETFKTTKICLTFVAKQSAVRLSMVSYMLTIVEADVAGM